MKQTFLLSALLLVSFFAIAQNNQVLDTIPSNEATSVALFFPEGIKRAITGSPNFVFTYNKERSESYGLLQATSGANSNLLVLGESGSIFSYILTHAKAVTKLNYFVPLSNRIGTISQSQNSLEPLKESSQASEQKIARLERLCQQLLVLKPKFHGLKTTRSDITLTVENIIFDTNEFYFVITIKNSSTLPYDLNFLKLSLQTRKKGKRTSVQTLYQKPIYLYGVPDRIEKNQTVKLIYVSCKVSIDSDRRVVLELNEKNGVRDLLLKIGHRHINNPD